MGFGLTGFHRSQLADGHGIGDSSAPGFGTGGGNAHRASRSADAWVLQSKAFLDMGSAQVLLHPNMRHRFGYFEDLCSSSKELARLVPAGVHGHRYPVDVLHKAVQWHTFLLFVVSGLLPLSP